jgi:aspartate kinase
MAKGTIVMKFGGTSVADAERLKRAAARIVRRREEGHDVVGGR